MNKLILVAALLLSLCGSAEDEALWAEVGKAEAAGWNAPVKLPQGEARALATFGGDARVHQVTSNVTGDVWCEAQFEGEQLKANPACYFEFRGAGHDGVICGAYERKVSDGKVTTKRLRSLYHGLTVVYGALATDGKKAVPATCTLYSRPIGVVLRVPEDGAEIADNTPDFAWYSDDPLGVTVEWSRDASFPEKSTERRPVADPTRFFTVEKPLAPGLWHWRVITASGFVSPVRRFRQTASASADCTPPEIVAAPRFLPLPTSFYGFRVGADADKVTASVGDETLRLRVVGERVSAEPPKQGWPVGVSRLELTACDKAGNVARSVTWVSYAPNLPKVVWGGAGEPVRIGGRPFDLRLFYCCDSAERFDRVKELGFTAVQDYGRDHRLPTPTDVKALDDIGARGMMTMVAVNREAINKGDLDRVASKIGAYLPRKELLAWYLFDEPDVQDVPPERVRRAGKLIKALDPSRPRLLTTYYPTLGADKYTDCCDVFLTQAYCATAEQSRQKWEMARKAFAQYQPAVKHTLILGPGRTKDAKELAEQMRLGMKDGCGIMLWAWHYARQDARQVEMIREATTALRLSTSPPPRPRH